LLERRKGKEEEERATGRKNPTNVVSMSAIK
jgi:hypothetical protein